MILRLNLNIAECINNYFELLFLGLYPPESDHLDLYTSCIEWYFY